MQVQTNSVVIIIIIITAILLFLGLFIIGMLFVYQKKQLTYEKTIAEIKSALEKNSLMAELEIKEQIFQNISREIHDNISLNLTLVKLKLNTLDLSNTSLVPQSISSSIDLLSKAILDLSDISKTLNSDIIYDQGLLKALELELKKVRSLGLHKIIFETGGTPLFMEARKELIIFRIIQECLNNILKHAEADQINLKLDYQENNLEIKLIDNGKGFDLAALAVDDSKNFSSGLRNIHKRSELIKGNICIESRLGTGTHVTILIPIN